MEACGGGGLEELDVRENQLGVEFAEALFSLRSVSSRLAVINGVELGLCGGVADATNNKIKSGATHTGAPGVVLGRDADGYGNALEAVEVGKEWTLLEVALY